MKILGCMSLPIFFSLRACGWFCVRVVVFITPLLIYVLTKISDPQKRKLWLIFHSPLAWHKISVFLAPSDIICASFSVQGLISKVFSLREVILCLVFNITQKDCGVQLFSLSNFVQFESLQTTLCRISLLILDLF